MIFEKHISLTEANKHFLKYRGFILVGHSGKWYGGLEYKGGLHYV